ncbi:MAG: 16S rRNA (cytidine(1402)-2'-O)-methyltransferase [Bacillota bacterium]|jgi:16S rRNA (cytidine1402-2'-O)-methyltransferase
MKGKLYLVATPIGNLEDITLRAIRILGEVDLIAAEDTRQSRKLLHHLGIQKPLTSYFQHNERTKGRELIELLLSGKNIAIISDAGTPAISDPGSDLVKAAIKEQIEIVPIPGPSAVVTIISVSGLDSERFVFEGFLPRGKTLRRQYLQELAQEQRTMIFYEAPHRIKASLADMEDIIGDRQIVVGRELTKHFEEILRGSISCIRRHFDTTTPKGEFALVVAGCEKKAEPMLNDEQIKEQVAALMAEGKSRKQAAKEIAQRYKISANKVYDLTIEK